MCGLYADLAQSKSGCPEAERRAISTAMLGAKPLAVVAKPATEEAPKTKTIREHAETFMELYLPAQKPSERRNKEWSLDNHLLPVFGDRTIESLSSSRAMSTRSRPSRRSSEAWP